MESITSSKLFTTRQGTILLGVIAAVIAGIALLVFLNHYRNGQNVTVQVLVVKRTIDVGTPGNVIAQTTGPNAYYQVSAIPKDSVDKNAMTDTSQLAGKVALSQILPNSQLTTDQFGAASGITGQLNQHQRGVTISLGTPQALDGQISAGSVVDMWVTTSGQGSGGVSRPVSKLLIQDITVLGVNGGNITLQAQTSKQAGTIIFAATNDQIWFALRNAISKNIKPPVIGAGNVTGG